MTEIYYVIGGILPVALIALLVRRFVFGRMTMGIRRNLFATLTAWPIATVIGSFGFGEGGFVQRLQNVPDLKIAIMYGISTLILMVLLIIGAVVRGGLSEKPDA